MIGREQTLLTLRSPMSESNEASFESGDGEALVPIDLDLVPLHTPLSFPIFTREGDGPRDRYVLIKNTGSTLSGRMRDDLRQERGVICTKENSLKAYRRSVEAHLGDFLEDETIALDKRASLLYQEGETIMEEFFARPHSVECYEKTQELVRHIVRLTLSNNRGAQAMIRMAHRNYETYSHSLHVCILGVDFLQSVLADREILEQCPIDDDLEKLGQGLLYHDLGKAGIGSKILGKVGPLTPQEWEKIKRHPLDGVHLLREMGVRDRDIIHITLYHHERMNGTGYPYGLAGEEIPPVARIAAIADAFDAITSHRPYKKAVSKFRALTIMRDENAGFYDLALFRHFVRLFGSEQKSEDAQSDPSTEHPPSAR